MLNITLKRSPFGITVLLPCLVLTPAYAVPVGLYEVADFSQYNRDITLGSDIGSDAISSINGFNTLTLSGDNGFVKTVGDLAGFTYQSDWSWMTIVQSNQLDHYRVFMRGKAWQDKPGDFDLRLVSDQDQMNTWHRAPGWVNANATDTALGDSGLLWLASTYDYSEQRSTLYVNGINIGEFNISPMDDRANTNPLNINGQWAENRFGVGNVYVEGDFSIAQLILSQSLFTQSDLQAAYQNQQYMNADDATWFDFRINDAQVPEPSTLLLLIPGMLALARRTNET